MNVVVLRWAFYCHRCGHEWAEEQRVEETVINSPPPIPSYCEECGGRLSGNPHAWGRTFQIEEVV